MRARSTTLTIMLLLLSVTMLITGQSVADPSPQCVVVGRSAQGPAGEIQCRENALRSAAARQQPAMLFWLARTYASIGEAKAEENYRKIVTNHCASSPSLCEQAKKQLKELESLRAGPLAIETPVTPNNYSFAISADGNRLVYVATVKGKTALYIRHVDGGAETLIPGTDLPGYRQSGQSLFWKPDGKSIGYFHDGKLKRIDVDGRNARSLAEAPEGYGGSWSTNGTIIFVPRNNSSVFSVRADGDGSDVAQVTPATNFSQRYPQFLPDGNHFVFYWFTRGVAVGSLKGEEPRRLGITTELAQFVSPDQLLLERGGQVFAQLLDMQTFTPQGKPERIIERVAVGGTFAPGLVALTASASGAIAYKTSTTALRQLVWYDHQGRRGAAIGRAEATTGVPRVSRDGSSVGLLIQGGFGFFDLKTGAFMTRRARVGGFGVAAFVSPVWSPAGDAIAFSFVPITPRGGTADLFQQSWADSTPAVAISRSAGDEVVMDWSPNGFVLFRLGGASGDGGLYVQPATGGGEKILVSESATAGQFSPDREGRWIAYQTASGDRSEVYVQPFPGSSSQRQQVSLNGGHGPHWSHDGQELYFLSPSNQMMVVSIRAQANGNGVEFDRARRLFEQPLPDGSMFAPTADGRFIVHEVMLTAPPIYVLKDWTRSKVEPNTPLR